MMYLEGPTTLKNECKLSVRDLLVRLFDTTPSEHICVILDKTELTIETLSKCARQISISLSNESRVAICMDLSLELLIVLCGLILCGIPYVPLEPRLPYERLKYILDDSEASIVITTDENKTSLPIEKTKVMTYKDLMVDDTVTNKCYPNRSIDEEDIFCIMYTSGSTGRPKGVRLPYRALLNRLYWQWTMFPFDDSDVCCLKTSISFVDSIAEFLAPLLQRVRLIVIPKSLLLDVNQLISVLSYHCVTRIILVPSLLTVLLEYLSIQNKKMTNLRFIICSGETLSPNLIESFFDAYESDCQLLNLYGSTEVMADVTFEIFSSRDDLHTKCIDGRTSIGKPIDNMRVEIFNPDNDGIGELLVSGDGVASGYHHGEMLTDKFLPDPNKKGRLCFRTGDMGKIYNERIILFGRSDNQVKIAGNRVNLNEIELILKSHCNCRQPIVVMFNSQIIVFLQESEKSVHLDRNSLSTYLPKYAIPSSFITVAHFPLLVSGKIDRHELLRSVSENISEQSKEEIYSTTIAAFSRALEEFGIQRSDIDRNYFAAGGSSLNALLVVAKLHAAGFHSLTVERLINAPTLRDIELDLSAYKNQTERYFAEEIEDTHSFRFISLEQVDKQSALHILTESFVTHGEIDTLIHKHRTELKLEFMRQWGSLMDFNWSTYVASGVSFGVIDDNSRLIGLSLSYDIATHPLAQTESEEITLLTPLNIMIDTLLQNRIDQLRTREHLSRIMRSHVTTVDPSLSPAQRLTTMYFIEKHLLDVAKANKYQAVITANTSSVTQQLAEHVLKYDTNDMTRARDCYEPSTEKPIFPDAPSHYTVIISVKYMHPED